MARTLLLIGTRKGAFMLESDGDRRDWTRTRALLRELARLPRHATSRSPARSTPPPRASGTAPPSGGAPTSVRRGRSRARASRTRDGRKLSKVSSLAASHGRVLVGAEAPGIFESRDGGETLVAADDARRTAGQRGLGQPGEPASGSSRYLCDHARPRRSVALLDDRPGRRSLRDDRRRQSWTPRNRGLRPTGRAEHEEVGFCVHKFVRSPRREPHVPAEPRRHAPLRRRRRLLDRDHGWTADASSASPPPRIRTTGTPST